MYNNYKNNKPQSVLLKLVVFIRRRLKGVGEVGLP